MVADCVPHQVDHTLDCLPHQVHSTCSHRHVDDARDFYGRPTVDLFFCMPLRTQRRIAVLLNGAYIGHFASLAMQVDFPSYIEMQTWPGAFAINIPFVRARIHAREMIARSDSPHLRSSACALDDCLPHQALSDACAREDCLAHQASAPLIRCSRLHAPSRAVASSQRPRTRSSPPVPTFTRRA